MVFYHMCHQRTMRVWFYPLVWSGFLPHVPPALLMVGSTFPNWFASLKLWRGKAGIISMRVEGIDLLDCYDKAVKNYGVEAAMWHALVIASICVNLTAKLRSKESLKFIRRYESSTRHFSLKTWSIALSCNLTMAQIVPPLYPMLWFFTINRLV